MGRKRNWLFALNGIVSDFRNLSKVMVDPLIPIPLQSRQELSIILMVNGTQLVDGIRRAEDLVQAIFFDASNSNTDQQKHQVILVGAKTGQDAGDVSSSQSGSSSIAWRRCDRLSEAIQAASKQSILVIDGEASTELDELIRTSAISSWPRACPTSDGSMEATVIDQAVQVGFISNPSIRLATRWLAKLYQLLIRSLLGIRKPSFKPGFVLLNQRQRDSLVGMNRIDDSNDPSISNTEQLLALLRLQGHLCVEYETRKEPSFKPDLSTVRAREILKRIWQTIVFWWNEIRFPARMSVSGGGIENRTSNSIVTKLSCWAVLLGLSCFLLLWRLDFPLFEPDETRNAQIAHNLIESGNWLTLSLNDEPYRNKPPGLAWMIAASYEVFGVNSWSTRLPNVLATIFTLMMVLGWGEKLVGQRAAFLAAMSLLLSVGFMVVGRYVVMDAGFTCCIVGMSLALVLAEGKSWRWQRNLVEPLRINRHTRIFWLLKAGILAGIGMMLKGPVIFLVVLPPVFATYALEGRLSFFWHRRILCFIIPCLMIGTPWYVAMAWVDPTFLANFLWRENLMRFSSAFDHEAPWWFYLPAILMMMFPASYLLPALVKYLWSKDEQTRGLRTSGQGYLVLMSGWVIMFFSLSQSKLVTYILPAIPGVALLIGAMLDGMLFAKSQVIQKKSKRASERKTIWNLIGQVPLHDLPLISPLGFVLMSVLIVVVLNLGWDCPLPGSAAMVAIGFVVLTLVALVPWWNASNVRWNWICLGVTGLALMLTLLHVLVPNLSQLRSLNQSLARLSRQAEYETAPIVFFERHPYGAELEMSGREIRYFKLEEAIEFRDFIAEHPLAVIIATEKNIKRYCRSLKGQVEVVRSDANRYIHFCHPRTHTAGLKKTEASVVR